jgi:hypothetical protein
MTRASKWLLVISMVATVLSLTNVASAFYYRGPSGRHLDENGLPVLHPPIKPKPMPPPVVKPPPPPSQNATPGAVNHSYARPSFKPPPRPQLSPRKAGHSAVATNAFAAGHYLKGRGARAVEIFKAMMARGHRQ